MMYFFIALLAVVLIFVLVILLRAAMFKPENINIGEAASDADNINIPDLLNENKDKIVKDLSDMLKCKTVSSRDGFDITEFLRFQKLLEERFPLIHKKAKLVKIGKTGLLYKIDGKNENSGEKNICVCMSHYDVVPAAQEQWDKPAFEGIVEDGCIWGRGAIDTKSTLCALTEALEMLLKSGYKPQGDLYLSFSGEEEIDGKSCPEIVDYLEKDGVKPTFVLDEGGAIVNHVFPGVTKDCAIVGTGEKGSVNFDFEVKSCGGHSSTPPAHTAAGVISKAVCDIEAKPFKRQLTKPVLDMFNTLGRYSKFGYKIIFANLWCFAPLLDIIARRAPGGELNSMLRTTVAVTKLHGSNAYNVLPPNASCGVNVRLMGKDTIDSAKDYLSKAIGNSDVKCSVVSGTNPSAYSDTECAQWHLLKSVINETWRDVIVTPYLMPARSDAGHYCRITDKVYRFSAMSLSAAERAMTHGNNERISVDNLMKTVEFYVRLLKRL